MRRGALLLAALCLAAPLGARPKPSRTDAERVARFSRQLHLLRRTLDIPGLSAAVLRDGRLLWAGGDGWADRRRRRRADARTVYPIASLTKTFAALLLFDLAREGHVDLDVPMTRFDPAFPNDPSLVRDVLSHASRRDRARSFRYDSARFKTLSAVLSKVTGTSFRELLWKKILDPLGLADSVPGPDAPASLADPARATRYGAVLTRQLAQAYAPDRRGRPRPSGEVPSTLSAASGLLSSVRDLALYDQALTAGRLLPPDDLEDLWRPAESTDGPRPYAHGWYVTRRGEDRVVWHPGYLPGAGSALYVKLPEEALTLILLANADGLVAPFAGRLLAGQVDACPAVLDFLRLFVDEPRGDRRLPDPAWGKNARRFDRRLTQWTRQTAHDFTPERTARADIERWRAARRAAPRS